MTMQAHTDALLRASEPPRGQRRQTAARSHQDRCVAFEKPEIERDAFALYNHGGTIAVASAWLVIYVIAAIQLFIAGSPSLIQ
jgi:hypothetical protein